MEALFVDWKSRLDRLLMIFRWFIFTLIIVRFGITRLYQCRTVLDTGRLPLVAWYDGIIGDGFYVFMGLGMGMGLERLGEVFE